MERRAAAVGPIEMHESAHPTEQNRRMRSGFALAAACVSAALPRVCVRCAHAVCCVYALGAAAS
jgi:hypothetical protein